MCNFQFSTTTTTTIIKKIIILKEGAWSDLEKIQLKPLVKNHNIFLYEVYKQQYLEYIENHDIQKVYNRNNIYISHLHKAIIVIEEYIINKYYYYKIYTSIYITTFQYKIF